VGGPFHCLQHDDARQPGFPCSARDNRENNRGIFIFCLPAVESTGAFDHYIKWLIVYARRE